MSGNANSPAHKSGDRDIVAVRVFDAPRELVWKMWTDPKHIAQWWGPNGFRNTIAQMDVRPCGEWTFVMHGPDGTDYKNHIVYKEVVRPERLTYRHDSGPLFDVETIFEDLGEKTRVSMRMTFDSAAIRDKTVDDYGAIAGLDQTLGRLAEKLASVQNNDRPFSISRVFDAPRELVFEVWTDAKHLAKWFGPKGATVVKSENDLRPGGIYHYGLQGPDGSVMWGKWIYREVAPPERLVFLSMFSDEHGGVTRAPFPGEWPMQTLSTIRFDLEGTRTRVTVEWTPYEATESEREFFATMHGGMNMGWSGTFDVLAEYLAAI